ncbi:alpha/beta hydrolase [Novosphingobium sp. PP1Y]|uniref:alpha/beta hydrolase n=1 Tax=Novosphingobium sp. PP1Y TaxID=702113 RepID=UPI00020EFB42|nr:alpha/beta hydrolase fold domain-containing protein [Novosphingobium sp. PP1Y]CCA90032.1 conserved hypothetical protein [Novosphingobium sp. PP1Y]
MNLSRAFTISAALLVVTGALPVLAATPEEIHLWPGKAPGTEKWTQPEQVAGQPGRRRITNVSDPTVTVYLPEAGKANGTAIIVAPGGGMRALNIDAGGTSVAEWLSARGYTALVLKYRIRQQAPGPPGASAERRPALDGGEGRAAPSRTGARAESLPMAGRPEMVIRDANADPAQDDPEMAIAYRMAVADAGQAIRLVRANSAKWHVDPAKVGIMGFSAGGGVAVGSGLAEAGPGYPSFVISLYGPSLMDVNVPAYAAPLFMAVKQDHWNVTPGLIALFDKWREAKKPVELHVFDMANGAIGMEPTGTPIDSWLDRVTDWLALHDFAPRPNVESDLRERIQ